MTKDNERQLMRLIHGELSSGEAQQLERELERNAELRATHDRLAQTWASLELPVSEPPGGFADDVMSAARGQIEAGRRGELSWSLAPAWARGGAAAALFTGLLLGTAFGRGFELPTTNSQTVGSQTVIVADVEADAVPLSLAEVYWLSLEESDGTLIGDDLAEDIQ